MPVTRLVVVKEPYLDTHHPNSNSKYT